MTPSHLPAFRFPTWHCLCVLLFGLAACVAQAQTNPSPMPPATNPPTETAPPTEPAPPTQLPPGYKPPRAVPPVITFNKELTSEAQSDVLAKELQRPDRRYTNIFSTAVLNNETKQVIQTWAKWRAEQMTLKSKRRMLHEVRSDLMKDLVYAGGSKDVSRKDVEKFRYYLCEELVKQLEPLLKNNFYVRLNAVIVLANLNLTEEDPRKQIPEQAYVKAALPLLDVLNAPTGGEVDQQLEAVKIQAAIGLGRINLLGPANDLNFNIQNQTLRNTMAKTLIGQLDDPKANDWYQKRLIDSLATIDMVNDTGTGKPIILEKLGNLLVDKNCHFIVRARAARGLGRCVLPPGVNVEKLVFQILMLENEMALAYQKNPNAYYWLDCFQDVYFAFHPVADSENQLYGNKRLPGLNQKNLGNQVREAYVELLPIASHVVNQPGWTPKNAGQVGNAPIPDNLISNLGNWLQNHQPSSHKLAPGLPDLAPPSPVPTAKATSTTSG